MKKIIALIVGIPIILGLSTYKVEASEFNKIQIEGNFEEWNQYPSIGDSEGDTPKKSQDIINLGYFTDEDYLYIDIERATGSNAEPWHFNVVIFNGIGYQQSHTPLWNEADQWGNRPSVQATTVEVLVDRNWSASTPAENYVVKVSIRGKSVEQTFSATPDGKRAEFRVPLEQIGLAGTAKEVIFAVKSGIFEDLPGVEWVGDEGPINSTTGPVLGDFTPIAILAAFIFVGIKFKR